MNSIVINLDGKKLFYVTKTYKFDEDFISFKDIKGVEKKFSKKLVEEISRENGNKR